MIKYTTAGFFKGPLMQTSSKEQFLPGFRISIVDALVLVAGTAGAAFLRSESADAAVLLAMPVLHFFLFCNVFRIKRRKELIWAAIFVISSAFFIVYQMFSEVFLIIANFLVAAILIALETREPDYHGIFWQNINPGLEQWWENRSESSARTDQRQA